MGLVAALTVFGWVAVGVVVVFVLAFIGTVSWRYQESGRKKQMPRLQVFDSDGREGLSPLRVSLRPRAWVIQPLWRSKG